MYSTSLLFGLSFATAALAQIQVNGAGSIAASLIPSNTATPASAAGSSSAPAATTSAASSASSAPASQITSAASYDASSASAAAYSMMPYSSFMAGGYKSMDCGYGYSKASDGSCKSESWVRVHHHGSAISIKPAIVVDDGWMLSNNYYHQQVSLDRRRADRDRELNHSL